MPNHFLLDYNLYFEKFCMQEQRILNSRSQSKAWMKILNAILFDELQKKSNIHTIRYIKNWIQRFFFIAGVNKNKTTAASSATSKISHHLATFGSSSEDPQKQIETSGFSTKDSSDSKSHDSGIDSIEKPGTRTNNFVNNFYWVSF